MREIERKLRALANKRRLAIIKYLKTKKEAPVGDIAEEIGLSFKSTSRHLAILSSANILDKEQRSLQVFYSVASLLPPFIRQVVSEL